MLLLPLTAARSSIFLSTPSARRATSGCCRTVAAKQFLSTPSARRATGFSSTKPCIQPNFYPRPPRGGRRALGGQFAQPVVFLSTPSARRATPDRSARCWRYPISIHALREEGDESWSAASEAIFKFLSTPSARRATCTMSGFKSTTSLISIHALREEGDRREVENYTAAVISIHALREEGDQAGYPSVGRRWYFYPRPPRGGRPAPAGTRIVQLVFLSTPSARRATAYCTYNSTTGIFLSTPSARRATHYKASTDKKANDFYPRPPRGGRLQRLMQLRGVVGISIHALREEGDRPARPGA